LTKQYSLSYTLYVSNEPSEYKLNDVKKLLTSKGYELSRIHGSHHIFTQSGFPTISIPVEKGKVKRYYVKQIEKIEETI